MSTIIPSHWGHQEKFRVETEALAAQIFDELDPQLRPRVLLIGLVADHEQDLYPLFVEAGEDEYTPSLFQQASRIAKEHRQQMYEEARERGEPDPIGTRKRQIVLEAWRLGVVGALAEGDEEREVVSFCSEPRTVDKFQICTVLQLNRVAHKSYYRLAKDTEDENQVRPCSLLDATIMQYMRKCAVGLSEHDAGFAVQAQDWDHEEILRAAGRQLTDFPALGGRLDVTRRGLFNAVNTISSLRYEGEAATGELIISRPDHEGVKCNVELEVPVRLYNYTAVRKLLEASAPGYSLLSDGAVVYGFGALRLESSLPGDSLFRVGFIRHYTWELAYGMRTLMRVTYGQPRLPKIHVLESQFRQAVAKTFTSLDLEEVEQLWVMAHTATQQAHGTILVIHDVAEQEAARLSGQGAPIKPVPLDPDGLLSLTAIDGAVLMDRNTVCHAFGVILDGMAMSEANPARGARYNSALRYVRAAKKPCLAVVVSEDGGVEVVANGDVLRPSAAEPGADAAADDGEPEPKAAEAEAGAQESKADAPAT